MEKIVIHLIIPSIAREYDIRIPRNIVIRELTELIARAVEEVTDKLYVSSNNEILCLEEDNLILLEERNIKSYNIQNGDHIFLI